MSLAARWFAISVLLGCCALAIAASPETKEEALTLDGQPLQTDVASLTAVRLHLQYGDFKIVAGDSDEVTIRTTGKNAEQGKKMKVRIERTGDALDLTFLHVPKNQVQVVIVVPRETSLYARMRAGDLTVNGVSGDKDLELTAGDLSVEVPNAAEYGPVDLSVRMGDVSASEFGNPKGVMGNSLRHDGTGKYRFHAHVFAGDLRVTQQEPSLREL